MERSRNIEFTEQCTGETSTDEKGWQEEGEREGLKVLKMAHLSLQLRLYQFTKGRYGKRHLKRFIKAVTGTSRILKIVIFSFNQNERYSNFQVSSRILRHSGLK